MSSTPPQPAAGTDDRLAMGLLAAHIPLTLLLDLAETFGPPSRDIFTNEDCDGAARWLPQARDSAAPVPANAPETPVWASSSWPRTDASVRA